MISRILLVSSHDPEPQLIVELEKAEFQVNQAWSLAECRAALWKPGRYDLLITDERLTDGTWSQVLDLVRDSSMNCEVIVSSRTGDAALWAEVLNRGGFDVLVKPYHGQELERIIDGAIGSNYLKKFAAPVRVASIA